MTWAIKLADERREAREEGREEGRREGHREGRREGRREGNITALYDLYNDGDITLQRAAVKAGMSESAFLEAAKKIMET